MRFDDFLRPHVSRLARFGTWTLAEAVRTLLLLEKRQASQCDCYCAYVGDLRTIAHEYLKLGHRERAEFLEALRAVWASALPQRLSRASA